VDIMQQMAMESRRQGNGTGLDAGNLTPTESMRLARGPVLEGQVVIPRRIEMSIADRRRIAQELRFRRERDAARKRNQVFLIVVGMLIITVGVIAAIGLNWLLSNPALCASLLLCGIVLLGLIRNVGKHRGCSGMHFKH
jgi:hypothetical protein